jgi:hypothetical protein
MKIGTSLSRCVRDIYEDTVHIDEVLVVIARTDFDPEDDKQWIGIWEGYAGGNAVGSIWSNPEWSSIPAEDEQAVRDICINLKQRGKLHQPRQYGAHPPRMNHYWYDVMLTPENLETNVAAKKAWENYKLLAELTYK